MGKKPVQLFAICEIMVYHCRELELFFGGLMVSISKEQHLDMFLKMQQIRDVDMKLNKLVRRGFVQGMTHFSVGEEAAAVGPIAGLTEQDIIFSHHRGHGHVIAKGIDINGMMAELAGKATGTSKGRGGSMHLANVEKGNFGSNGIQVVVTPSQLVPL